MLNMRVDASIAHETDEMKLVFAAALHCVEKKRLAKKRAAVDKRVNARDVHMDDPSRAHVQVAHFAVSHLSFGQADEGTRRMNQCVGKISEKMVVVRLAS